MISQVDILPTIFELLELDILENINGHSFLSLVQSSSDQRGNLSRSSHVKCVPLPLDSVVLSIRPMFPPGACGLVISSIPVIHGTFSSFIPLFLPFLATFYFTARAAKNSYNYLVDIFFNRMYNDRLS